MTGNGQVDVLAIGAHPDDVELGIGGIIHKLARLGHTVAILDLTRGELSSRGTVSQRKKEAAAASKLLGIMKRENVGLHDGAIANTHEQQLRVIPYIRMFRPKLLLSLMREDRHPDHHAAHALVRDAVYYAGLLRIQTEHEPYRPPHVLYYHPYSEGQNLPQLVVDISDDFEAKLDALRQYRSQFFNPEQNGPQTHISSAAFWEQIRTRALYWGNRIGVKYGETLFVDGPVGVALPPGIDAL